VVDSPNNLVNSGSGETTKSFEISPGTQVSHVKLRVHSIERSLLFYEELLGFKLVSQTDESAQLSAEGSDDVSYLIHLSKVGREHKLIEGEQSAAHRAGLFHFAILLPSRKYLANMFKRLTENSNQLCFEGAADHLVSESLYLRDPDSNGVEIYRDRDRSEWVRKSPFQVKMSTEHLDLDRLYSEAGSTGQWSIPNKTVIGHVHLHVSNLQASKIFYSEILGLHHTCVYPGANFFAANSYHHHVATNTWLGTNIQRADSREPGLDHFALKIESKENYERLFEQLKNMNIEGIQNDGDKVNKSSIFIYDPDRIKIQIHY
jgi:catechol 2,3-dioxygenase